MSHPQVTFKDTVFTQPTLLSIRRGTVAKVTLRAQLDQLKTTGRYDCFKLKWHPIYDDKSEWPVPKHLFWDSDVAKWIEGACYFLTQQYDKDIDNAVQELVEMIRSAQQEDGYLNLHYTVVEPGARWTNLRDMHELYNAGHMIEGALAHMKYYRNNRFLAVVERYVHLIWTTFGPADHQKHGYPGHPEIELALFRLYSATGNREAYQLAEYFIQERGKTHGQDGTNYFDEEAAARGDSDWKRPNPYPVARAHWYNQSHLPILEQTSVEGHAVRAMYLLTAVADMAYLAGPTEAEHPQRQEWTAAADRLWDNMVDKKMYVTGGIGAIYQWEGFGKDYFLPQSVDEGGCYSETCASIAVMMFAERMLHLRLDARYADVLELCLYNNVFNAMSIQGKAFTYENPLASCDEAFSKREDWFCVACCPPNITRLFGSIGAYLWDYDTDEDKSAHVNVHLYTSAKLHFGVSGHQVNLEQRSNWPWEGDVHFTLNKPAEVNMVMRVRIPGWANDEFSLSPSIGKHSLTNGYLTIPSSYLASNNSFTLRIGGFQPRFIAPHPYTNQQTLTLARGPMVYCVEDADNDWVEDHFRNVMISHNAKVSEEKRRFDLSGEEYIALHAKGSFRSMEKWNKQSQGTFPGATISANGGDQTHKDVDLVFIPYYLRANRGGRGQMRVGLLRA